MSNYALASLDSDITAIKSDQNGYIWYAGQSGLKLMVGTKKLDMLDEELPSKMGIIRDIEFVKDDLYLATKHLGIWSLKQGKSIYAPKIKEKTMWVKDLLFYPQENFVLAMGNGFIHKYFLSGDKQIVVENPEISFFRAIEFDSKFVIVSNSGIFLLEGNRLQKQSDEYAYDILKKGELFYIATPKGLKVLDSTFSESRSGSPIVQDTIYSLYPYKDIILAGGDEYLYKIQNSQSTKKKIPNCGRIPRIYAVEEIFIGCQQGLHTLNRHYSTYEQVKSTTLVTQADGSVWLASINQGIATYKNNMLSYVAGSKEITSNKRIFEIEKIGSKIYLGTNEGLYEFDVETKATNHIIQDKLIHSIKKLQDGSVLVGGYENYLAKYNGESIKILDIDERITTVIDIQTTGNDYLISDDSGIFKLDSQFKTVEFLDTSLTTNTIELNDKQIVAITHGNGALLIDKKDFSYKPLVNKNLFKNLSTNNFIYGVLNDNKLFIYHRGGYGYYDFGTKGWVNISIEPTTFIRRPIALLDKKVVFSDDTKLISYVPTYRQEFRISVPQLRRDFESFIPENILLNQDSGTFTAFAGSNSYTEEALNNIQYSWQFNGEPVAGRSFDSEIPMHTSPQSLLGTDGITITATNFASGQTATYNLDVNINWHPLLRLPMLAIYVVILLLLGLIYYYRRLNIQARNEQAERLQFVDLKRHHQELNGELGKIMRGIDHIKNVILVPFDNDKKQEFVSVYQDLMYRIKNIAEHFNQPFSYDLDTALRELIAEAKDEQVSLSIFGGEALVHLDRKVENAMYNIIREALHFIMAQKVSQDVRLHFKTKTRLGSTKRIQVRLLCDAIQSVDEHNFACFKEDLNQKMHRYLGSLEHFSWDKNRISLELLFKAVSKIPDAQDKSKERATNNKQQSNRIDV